MTLTSTINVAVGLLAAAALYGLLCRLNELTWRTHSWVAICMHLGLAVGCCWALGDVYRGEVNPGTLGIIVASLCWLYLSLPTWRYGPPQHLRAEHDAPAPRPTPR